MSFSRTFAPTTATIAISALCGGLAHADQAVGLTTLLGNASAIFNFDTATPGVPVPIPVTGLQLGETLLGIDFRPVNGTLFGLGSSSRLYTINTTTGVATQVGTGTFAVPLAGTSFGFDFNPVVDRIRVVSNSNQNLRLNPDTGAVVDFDTNTAGTQPDGTLAYRQQGDPNFGSAPTVVAAAYTNNNRCTTATALFVLDAGQRVLARVAPPNDGTLNTVATLSFSLSGQTGFDIAPNSNTAFVVTQSTGPIAGSSIYQVSLTNGNGMPLGSTVAFFIEDLALLPAPDCVADVDNGSGTGVRDGGVTIDDLLYYLDLFEQGVPCADVDDGSNTGTRDGGVTIDDLLYFLTRFEAGC